MKNNPGSFLLSLPVLVGMAMLFLVTPHGVGISPDSIAYIKGAQSLLEHGSSLGLSTHWPPGYSGLLALFAFPNHDYFIAARVVDVLMFGLSLLCFGILLQRCGWDKIVASLLAVLLVFDPDFLNMHLMAWSEPVFLLLVLVGLLAFLNYCESQSTNYLYATAIAFGLSVIIRYVGLSLVIGLAGILFFQAITQKDAEPLVKRLRPLLQFVLIAALPIFLWIICKHTDNTQDGVVRSVVFHPVPAEKWHEGLAIVSKWYGGPVIGLMLLAISATFLVTGWHNLSFVAKRLLSYAAVLLLAYFLFVVFSLFFFYSGIPLDQRILSPVKLLMNLLLFVSLQALAARWRLIAIAALTGLTLFYNYPTAKSAMSVSSQSGVGYARVDLARQPILSFIKLNHIAIDASNSPETLFVYLHQDVPLFPNLYNYPVNHLPNANYAKELAKLAQPRNTVAFFFASEGRDYLPNVQQLVDAGFTSVIYQQPDGIILQHPDGH